MAQRRFISKNIIHQSNFLSMPSDCMSLYMFLVVNADDDGYVDALACIRICGVNEQVLSILEQNGFIKTFPNLVVHISEWDTMNKVKPSEYHQSRYKELYPVEKINDSTKLIDDTSRTSRENLAETSRTSRHRIGKVRLGKDSIKYNIVPPEGDTSKIIWKKELGEQYITGFNKLFKTNYILTSKREEKLKQRLKTYTLTDIATAMVNLSQSKFHQGDNDRGWRADPDFLIRSDEQIDKWLNSGGKNER